MKKIDINCDLAELEEVDNQAFMPFISSVNICCGEHAGNPDIINLAIRTARNYNLKIGAHPSYPDRENFGRKSMEISKADLAETLLEQIIYIKLLVEKEGGKLHHVKAHGALYNDLFYDEEKLECFLDVVKVIDPKLKIYALAHSVLTDKIRNKGFEVVAEAFIDRRYTKEGLLRSRNENDAILDNLADVKKQLDLLLVGRVESELKETIALPNDSLCIHGDTTNANIWMPEIYTYIKSKGFEIV